MAKREEDLGEKRGSVPPLMTLWPTAASTPPPAQGLLSFSCLGSARLSFHPPIPIPVGLRPAYPGLSLHPLLPAWKDTLKPPLLPPPQIPENKCPEWGVNCLQPQGGL